MLKKKSEKLLQYLWEKDPHPTKEYCDLKAKLMIAEQLERIADLLKKRNNPDTDALDVVIRDNYTKR